MKKRKYKRKIRNKMKDIWDKEKDQKDETSARKTLQKKKSALDQAKEQYNKLESIWLNNQAVVLASHLHDGESCPVCGSLEHPQKATSQAEDVSKDMIEEHKMNVDQK